MPHLSGSDVHRPPLQSSELHLRARLVALNHERAADDRGWELLERAQINPQGMVNFFAGLKTAADVGGAPPIALLSTHPAPQERLDRLRQKAAALAAREFRSFAEEFRGLQAALGLAVERP